jgi:hypothetical protein
VDKPAKNCNTTPIDDFYFNGINQQGSLLWTGIVKTRTRAAFPRGGISVDFVPITVDYDKPLSERFAEEGYETEEPGITDRNFPALPQEKGRAERMMTIVDCPNGMAESDEVIAHVVSLGCRTATLRETLEYLRLRPIPLAVVALGPIWTDRGEKRVVIVGPKALYLGYYDGLWTEGNYFAVVKLTGDTPALPQTEARS